MSTDSAVIINRILWPDLFDQGLHSLIYHPKQEFHKTKLTVNKESRDRHFQS